MNNAFSGYFLILAWTITLAVILLIAKTKVGYTILYYYCIASIIIVLAVGSPTIIYIFKQANPSSTPKGPQLT